MANKDRKWIKNLNIYRVDDIEGVAKKLSPQLNVKPKMKIPKTPLNYPRKPMLPKLDSMSNIISKSKRLKDGINKNED